LTFIAEAVLQQVVQHAWDLITNKYGTPGDKTEPMAGFGILGFGKLGGIELGYSSDLDMVFLYECTDGNALTNGKKAIGCTQFYIRLAQKIMHLLQTKLLSGMLYEADMRLRPSGNSGLLVTHVSAYEDYFRNEAWTWEHQALVRARFITGDPKIKTSFDKIRHTILCLPRPVDTLKTEVREMREKMRANLAVKDNKKFDLKQSKGGIADIEFIVQFNVLARAAEQPLLTAHTDNIHLLESLQQHGYLTDATASTLKDAYISYRNRVHREALQGNQNIVPADEYEQMRNQVTAIWEQFMEE
jgi:glutamate-ammonia-ligase adenylyltransferase